jgi:hypothetical protein
MNPTRCKRIPRIVLLAALAVAVAGVSGCGNAGEGRVQVNPKVRGQLGKPPGVPGGTAPPGIKSRLAKNAGAK